MRKNIRMRGLILAGALTMGLGLSGCGSESSTTSATTGAQTEGTTVEMITESTKSPAEDATIAPVIDEDRTAEDKTEAGSTEAEEEDEENYEGVKHYALADSLDHKAFYVRNPICVVESGKNLIPVGSEWNEQVQPIPADIKLARRVES